MGLVVPPIDLSREYGGAPFVTGIGVRAKKTPPVPKPEGLNIRMFHVENGGAHDSLRVHAGSTVLCGAEVPDDSLGLGHD
jgi:hypothetical protein